MILQDRTFHSDAIEERYAAIRGHERTMRQLYRAPLVGLDWKRIERERKARRDRRSFAILAILCAMLGIALAIWR